MTEPLIIDPEDAYDRAYSWAWEEANMQELVRLCYKSPDLADNARRFYESEEFAAQVSLLRAFGLGAKADVLDFGCGNGVATYALSRAGFQAVGIDSSMGRLAGLNAARQLNGLDGTSLLFRYNTGETLPFDNGSFDLVYIREVLHHIGNMPAFLKEIKRVLKPGGLIACWRDVVIWNESQRADFFKVHPLNHITQDEGCYYLDEYVLAFVEAGLFLRHILAPPDSVINTYPLPFAPTAKYDFASARTRETGYDIFSFIACRA